MDDTVYRQAAIDALADYIHNVDKVMGTGHMTEDDCKDAATSVLEELPSAERKNGKWIPVTNGRGGFECDECHNYAPSFQDGVEWLSDYCPNCGADMRTSK